MKKKLIYGLIIGLSVLTVACITIEEKNVRFDIISKGESSSYYGNKSELYIITDEKELNDLKLLPEDLKLDSDFQNEFLIVTFLGRKPSSGYIFDIEEILKKENVLEIYSNVTSPKGGIDVITSPYVVAKVQRTDIGKGNMTFMLYLNKEKSIQKIKDV